MPEKLYRVTIEDVVFVLAQNESEAADIARMAIMDGGTEFHYDARKVVDRTDIDHNWRNSRPFTLDRSGYKETDPTCVQIVENNLNQKEESTND